MKRLITLFAAIAFAGQAWADDFTIGNLKYTITDAEKHEVSVGKISDDNKPQGDLVIPAEVENDGVTYSVTSIGAMAFERCSGLTTITIPESVTSVGYSAFYNCNGLTSIIIPNSVTSIGFSAFWYCIGLTTVTIPNSVTSIGKDAFGYVKNIVYSGSAEGSPWGALNVNAIPDEDGFIYSDAEKTNLTAYVGDEKEVIIPNSVTSIRDNAFAGCRSLTSVTIPESVTKIGGYAFRDCSGLASLAIPNSVTSIGYYAFYLVKNIVYSGNAEGSPWGALTVNGIIDGDFVYSDAEKTKLTGYISNDVKSVTIPESVTIIGKYAFVNCDKLTSVTIPNTVDTIGKDAFAGCTATIYCDVEKRPNGWDWEWCGEEYKGEIVWKTATPVIESAANAVNIYAYGRNIVVENAADEISVYDVMGRPVCRDAARHVSTITVNGTGIYIVKVGNIAKRVAIN